MLPANALLVFLIILTPNMWRWVWTSATRRAQKNSLPLTSSSTAPVYSRSSHCSSPTKMVRGRAFAPWSTRPPARDSLRQRHAHPRPPCMLSSSPSVVTSMICLRSCRAGAYNLQPVVKILGAPCVLLQSRLGCRHRPSKEQWCKLVYLVTLAGKKIRC